MKDARWEWNADKKELKRLDTLAEDNRRLIIISRKKDKEIQELKQQLRKDQKSA